MKGTTYGNNLTIADVADALGVSKTTVSRAISGKGRIGEATRNKVLEFIKEYDYKPNVIAQSLAQQKTFNICAVMPGNYSLTDMPFFRKSLSGLVEAVGEKQYDVIVTMCQDEDISNLQRVISNRKVDGAVILRTVMDDPEVNYLKEKEVPFVVLGSVPDKDVIQVDNNHRAACRELTGRLLDKGMQRIALLGGDERHIVTVNRMAGFVSAFQERHFKVPEDIIFQNISKDEELDKAVDLILSTDAECIMCMDDTICSFVLRKLERAGIRVPQDMKVAAFYSNSILEKNVPSVTSLKFDDKELGSVCGRVLLDYIEGQKIEQNTILDYQVIMGDSTEM